MRSRVSKLPPRSFRKPRNHSQTQYDEENCIYFYFCRARGQSQPWGRAIEETYQEQENGIDDIDGRTREHGERMVGGEWRLGSFRWIQIRKRPGNSQQSANA